MIALAKTIVIRDTNGSVKTINNVSHISTELRFENDECIWIPKDEIEANGTIKAVYQNGAYTAMLMLPDGDNMLF